MAPNIVVRPSRPGDGAAMGRAHVLAWQKGYQHILPALFLDGLDAELRGRQWEERIESGVTDGTAEAEGARSITIVGELDGELLGLCTYGPYRPVEGRPADEATTEGFCELWGLNVHPEAWGSGLAQALMADTLAGLAARHPEPVAVLWVLADNARGRRFYDKEGWGADGAEQPLSIAEAEVTEVRYATDLGPYR